MKLRYKILGAIAIVLAVALTALGLAMSHTPACLEPQQVLTGGQSGVNLMKGAVHYCYGSPDVVRYITLPKPQPADSEVLVKVRAASVNPLDWHYLQGTPYMVRLSSGFGVPKDPRLGVDFAGTVEAVGRKVTRFKPGDAVFGGKFGAFAEYVVVRQERAIAAKPDNVSFEAAAAVPIAALTALQALRDTAHVRAGQKVLINGASGGVGTFAVQIAKSLGAEVTAVCSTRNLDLMRAIGADHVIDYTREDFTRGSARFDVILDTVSTHSPAQYRRVLNSDGVYVMIGSTEPGNWFGWLWPPLEGRVLSWFVSQRFEMMLADLNGADLAALAALMQSGRMKPVIDRTYPLDQAADALRYLEKGHARGKVVLRVD
jgi:NADPH:quinone reductase-like Zn-dependent oxidoreductase